MGNGKENGRIALKKWLWWPPNKDKLNQGNQSIWTRISFQVLGKETRYSANILPDFSGRGACHTICLFVNVDVLFSRIVDVYFKIRPFKNYSCSFVYIFHSVQLMLCDIKITSQWILLHWLLWWGNEDYPETFSMQQYFSSYQSVFVNHIYSHCPRMQ